MATCESTRPAAGGGNGVGAGDVSAIVDLAEVQRETHTCWHHSVSEIARSALGVSTVVPLSVEVCV